jgi:hypothetical protein
LAKVKSTVAEVKEMAWEKSQRRGKSASRAAQGGERKIVPDGPYLGAKHGARVNFDESAKTFKRSNRKQDNAVYSYLSN